jgi:ADP-ribose pyrophosphatase YjhB (NUDIX family)
VTGNHSHALGHCRSCGVSLGHALHEDAARLRGHASCTACGHTRWLSAQPVAGLLLVREGRVLLTRRAAAMERGAGLWAYAGGFVAPGESVEAAALRETREEARVEATITALVGAPHTLRDPHHLVVAYRGETDGEPVAGDEVSEVAWFTPHEIPWGELAFTTTERHLRRLVDEGLDALPAHPLTPSENELDGHAHTIPERCGRCGDAMRPALADEPGIGRCDTCGEIHWSNFVCGAAVHVFREGRLLLTRRSAHVGRGAGWWTPPGGHLDPGEMPEEAVVREAREEVGLDVAITGFVGVYTDHRDPTVVTTIFRAEADGEPRTSDEVSEVRWFAPDELPWGELFADTDAALRDSLARGFS